MDRCTSMDRALSRRLVVLRILLQSTNLHVSLETLASMVGVTPKTMSRDIDELSRELERYSNTMGITKTAGKLRLFLKKRREIEQFFLDKTKETAQFYFTKTLFSENHIMLKQAQAEIHFSDSNMFRIWKIYAEHMSKWGFYLDGGPVKGLKGDELSIRYYFFNYYWTLFKGLEWPFDGLNRKKIIESIHRNSSFFPEKLTQVESEKIAYWVAIIRVRNSLDKGLKKGSMSSWCETGKRKWEEVLPGKASISSFLGIASTDERIEEESLFFGFVLLKEVPSLRIWLLETLELRMKKTGALLGEILPIQSEQLEQAIGCSSQYKSLQLEIIGLWVIALVWGEYPLQFSDGRLSTLPAELSDVAVEQLFYPDFVTTCLFLGVEKSKEQFEAIYKKSKELVMACLPDKVIVVHFLVEAPFVKKIQLKEKLEKLSCPFRLAVDNNAKPDLILTNLTFIYSDKQGNIPIYYVSDDFTDREQKNLAEFCRNRFLRT